MTDHPLLRRLPKSTDCSNDELLAGFLDYVAEKNLELYPAQEEAILELFDDRNVILNTPTGSGKSLVALALHFRSLAKGRRSVYTCPIKALVNEKFLALCRDFGPENVGIATGDATVNRDAPILCCTAEILANYALHYGAAAPFREVVMDEFHYYADRERGVAWQVPSSWYFQWILPSGSVTLTCPGGEGSVDRRSIDNLPSATCAVSAFSSSSGSCISQSCSACSLASVGGRPLCRFCTSAS